MADGPSPLEVAAANGEEMPLGLSFPEQVMFQGLRNMYHAYRSGIIAKEQAKKEKTALIKSYVQWKQWERIFKETVEMRNRLSSSLTKVNKEGCEYCRLVVRVFDGRARSGGGDC